MCYCVHSPKVQFACCPLLSWCAKTGDTLIVKYILKNKTVDSQCFCYSFPLFVPGKDFTLLFLVLIFGKVSASNAFSACYTRQHSMKQLQADKSTHTWKKNITNSSWYSPGRTHIPVASITFSKDVSGYWARMVSAGPTALISPSLDLEKCFQM